VPPNELGQRDISEVPTGVPCWSPSHPKAHLTPELSKIVKVWPSLPLVAKAGILAMVEASKRVEVPRAEEEE
jgi:hypothetical protein